jgi:hypothetical protein
MYNLGQSPAIEQSRSPDLSLPSRCHRPEAVLRQQPASGAITHDAKNVAKRSDRGLGVLPLHTRDVISGVDYQHLAGDAFTCVAEEKGGRLRNL